MPLDNAKMTKSARHQMPKNGQNAIRRRSRRRSHTWTPRVRTPYIRRAPGRLNLQRTSLMLSVFAHSFTLLSFSNSVLDKLPINIFTGMCPAVFLHILKYWYRHITAIMWLHNALKLKKTYSFTVFSTFWWLFKVSCGVLQFSVIPPLTIKITKYIRLRS